ncbi:MAG: Hsp70 family protein, partial [Jatrophihabitantaceae bacterium]
DEIDRMMKDAEAHADEDRKRRDEAEIRNSAEAQQFATEKFLADSGDKLAEDKRAELQSALDELKKSLEGADFEAIKTAQEKVSHVASEAGGAMYEAAAAAAGDAGAAGAAASAAGAPSESAAADDGVVDAEVVDEGTDGTAEEQK